MAALARQVVTEWGAVAGELRAHLDQLAHAVRSFGDRDADRLLAAETAAGRDRVLDVLLEAVLRTENRGDSTLGIRRVALRPASLGEQGDGPMPGGLAGKGKTSNSRPEHEVVELVPHVRHLP